MSKPQQSDTDLVEIFKQNLITLNDLLIKINHEFDVNLDPIARVKLKELRNELLIEDVKLQDVKIEKITNLLDEIWNPDLAKLSHKE